jgi:hypothetical protein
MPVLCVRAQITGMQKILFFVESLWQLLGFVRSAVSITSGRGWLVSAMRQAVGVNVWLLLKPTLCDRDRDRDCDRKCVSTCPSSVSVYVSHTVTVTVTVVMFTVRNPVRGHGQSHGDMCGFLYLFVIRTQSHQKIRQQHEA